MTVNTASVPSVVRRLVDEGQDFEWYPTTQPMIDAIRRHIQVKHVSYTDKDYPSLSIIDCGAGDGRLLMGLAGEHSKLFSIEKSTILMTRQDDQIVPVGTDFHTATLIDKKVDIVVSNPPYSEYVQWAVKIITEAHARTAYLIIPERWENSEAIKAALEVRNASYEIIYTGDFLNAERAARAKVHIVCVWLGYNRSERMYGREGAPKVDPFDVWFDATFPKPPTPDLSDYQKDEQRRKEIDKESSQQMVGGKNLIESLVAIYNHDMSKLQQNYMGALSLDAELLQEMNVSVDALRKSLKQRIEGLKHIYWKKFFGSYSSITERLTTDSRKRILETIHENMAVEFNEPNAYAITLWVIRNANKYYDSQLLTLVEQLTRKVNIMLYKSNHQIFKEGEWRYNYETRKDAPKNLDRYVLDYRVVLDRVGGISNSSYSWDNSKNSGLSDTAAELLSDIVAVAKTIGWVCDETVNTTRSGIPRSWVSGASGDFTCNDGKLLMAVRAYKNGNMHIKFNRLFMLRLNIEFGRLKGWLRDKQDVNAELRPVVEERAKADKDKPIPDTEYETCFNSLLRIAPGTAKLLLAHSNVNVAMQRKRPFSPIQAN